MLTQGSKTNPVKLNDHVFGPILKEVHWGGKPPTIIITGSDQVKYGTISSTRQTFTFYTTTTYWVVEFPYQDDLPVFAVVKAVGVFAGDVNLIPTDPVLPTTSDFTGYVPYDGDYDPPEAKDPGFAMHSRPQTPAYDFTKPITLAGTNLNKVGLYRRGTSAQNAVDSIYGSQGTTYYPHDIVASQDISFAEGTFHAGDTIPAGTYHDVGFQTKDEIHAEVAAFPATTVTITVYKGGTFTVDPTGGSIGQKGTISVKGGTVVSNDVRSYDVFTVGALDQFGNKGIIV